MSLGLLISDAFAQTAAPAAGAAPGTPPPAGVEGALMQFLPLFLIFGVFYFMLIRPQQKKFEEHKKMIEALRRGDKVVTGGGILGTVVKVEGDEVTVEIAENVKVRVQKSTVTQVVSKTEPAQDNEKTDK
jgi:preprotein translocase subunit YajC